jgi:hypothetical protein
VPTRLEASLKVSESEVIDWGVVCASVQGGGGAATAADHLTTLSAARHSAATEDSGRHGIRAGPVKNEQQNGAQTAK